MGFSPIKINCHSTCGIETGLAIEKEEKTVLDKGKDYFIVKVGND